MPDAAAQTRLPNGWEENKLLVRAEIERHDREIQALESGLDIERDSRVRLVTLMETEIKVTTDLTDQVKLLGGQTGEISKALVALTGQRAESDRRFEQIERRFDRFKSRVVIPLALFVGGAIFVMALDKIFG